MEQASFRSAAVDLNWLNCHPTLPARRTEGGECGNEAGQVAGRSSFSMTGEYAKMRIERQDELTRAVQRRREEVRKKIGEKAKQEQAAQTAQIAERRRRARFWGFESHWQRFS